ncbi:MULTISPECIES: hypothetical protein [unclassified Pannonibacter]|uniref:hypothetical protein n=1 Tax=unclassified Pannonibacter TaxID=2627228 RepID=UPI001647A91B|nr:MULTISPECIES: hypothetical protein [unclassified Pannonibacter]
MSDLQTELEYNEFRTHVFGELRRRNLDCLNSVDLNNNAVTFFPLALPGNLWDGNLDGDYAHGIMKPVPLAPKNFVSRFWAESGTPFVGNDFLAEMLAEIQMMAPHASVSIAPVFKVPYHHDPAVKLNLSRKIHFDDDLKQYFMFSPYAVSYEGDSICLSTEYGDDDLMRAAYRAVWEAISRSIEPQMVADAEMERLAETAENGFNSANPKMSLAEYESFIRTAQRERNGWHHPIVQEMMYRAGQGFVSYMANLRFKHTMPYIYEDEDEDIMVYPRYANLYHAIFNGMGAKWVHRYRLMYDPVYRGKHGAREVA